MNHQKKHHIKIGIYKKSIVCQWIEESPKLEGAQSSGLGRLQGALLGASPQRLAAGVRGLANRLGSALPTDTGEDLFKNARYMCGNWPDLGPGTWWPQLGFSRFSIDFFIVYFNCGGFVCFLICYLTFKFIFIKSF